MTKPKIVHITTVHSAKDPRIFFKECLSLARNGFDVTLIAQGNKNYKVNDIKIKSIGLTNSRLKRLFMLQVRALFLAFQQKADIYHFHDPELVFLGFCLALFQKKVVYDVHEDVPKDIYEKQYLPRILRSPLSLAAKIVNKCCSLFFSKIITVTPEIALGFNKNKTEIVKNYPSPELYLADNTSSAENQIRNIGYIGLISENRGFEMINELSAKLKDHLNVSTLLAGRPSNALIKNKIQLNNQLNWVGIIEHSDIPQFLSQCQIGLVILEPTPAFVESSPLKMFEYMAAGIPVIASNFKKWSAIINKYNCGITVDPMSEQEVYHAIEYLVRNPSVAFEMGNNGRKAIVEEFDWNSQYIKLECCYQDILKKPIVANQL